MDSTQDTLAAALERHQIKLPDEQIETLDRYCRLLWQWNEKLNLTRHTDYQKFVSRDVVDSLALEPFLDSGDRVIDVGTGGGVPGVVLAVLRPDLHVTLSESVGKKARAVEAIVNDLGLKLPVYHGRAEELLKDRRYDALVARAVAPLAKLLTWFSPYWDSIGQVLVIKGPSWVEERQEARHRGLMHSLELRKLAAYAMPGSDGESVVLSIRAKP